MIIKNINARRVQVFFLLIFLLASCSASKQRYYFSRYSLTHKSNAPGDSVTAKVAQGESKEIYSEDVASNMNEDKVTPKLSDTLSLKKKISWENPDTTSLTPAAIKSDASDNHDKKFEKKRVGTNPKSERKKSSKAGIFIIIILAVIILGAVIVNNSIGDFGSGSIFHF